MTIPSSVASIGDFAFEFCSHLKSVTLESGTPPELPTSSEAFDDEATGFVIHVPSAAAISTYQAATGWNSYSSIIVTP